MAPPYWIRPPIPLSLSQFVRCPLGSFCSPAADRDIVTTVQTGQPRFPPARRAQHLSPDVQESAQDGAQRGAPID